MPPPARWAFAESEIVAGIETYPGLAHRQELIADHRRHPLRQRQQGDQRRCHGQGARLLRRRSTGSPAGGRRRPGSPGSSLIIRRIAPRLPDRRGGGGFRRAGCRPMASPRGMRHPGPRGRRRGERWPRPSSGPARWCCCRRPAPPSTSSPISRSAAMRFRASSRPLDARAARRAGMSNFRPHRHAACSAAGGGPSTAGPWPRLPPSSSSALVLVLAASPAVALRIGSTASISCATISRCCRPALLIMLGVSLLRPAGHPARRDDRAC